MWLRRDVASVAGRAGHCQARTAAAARFDSPAAAGENGAGVEGLAMERRRIILGVLAALVLAAAAVGLFVALTPASPDRQAFNRVAVGMELRDVYKTLGLDQAFSKTSPSVVFFPVRDGTIVVEFDRDWRAVTKHDRPRGWLTETRDWFEEKLGL